MLEIEGLCLNYGAFRALENVSLRLVPGELVVLLGANGAGKSSLFLTISGIHRAASGSIRLEGNELIGRRPASIVHSGLVQCPEGRKLFPDLSVEKNLRLGGYVHRKTDHDQDKLLEHVMQLFPILREKRNHHAGSLSGGQQQMVAVGRALMGRPRVLLLDEPSLGLAPLVVQQVFSVVQEINREGTMVLLAEQNAYSALRIAHRAYVLERGRVVLEGAPGELMDNPEVRRAYIGA